MMILKLSWDTSVVLSVKDAVTVAEILSKANAWEEKYESGGGNTTYHSYPCEKEFTMKLISDQLADMAKLAGKPEK